MNNGNPSKSFAPVPKYNKELKREKLKRKVSSFIIGKIANTPLQFGLYRSYWHYKLSNKKTAGAAVKQTHFLTQMPNYGAGIGHQLANWNSGLYFAKFYKVRFAHSPFSTAKWENFLGFGEGEVLASDLLMDKKFKMVRLPRFNSLDKREINLVGNIINSYKKPHVLFSLALDQGYMSQYHTYHTLSEKFFKARARENDALIYSPDKFNIAIHIRRRMKIETDEVWKIRGLDNEYFSNVLAKVLAAINNNDKAEIYLFSQGTIEDFPEFEKFKNIHYCLEMGPVESVLHMINADILISSKSSFSYKPALISRKIQICPETFWHGYPHTRNYILADNDGAFNEDQLLGQVYSSGKKNIINKKVW